MRNIITLAVGFLIARQLYINNDKQEARLKEKRIKKRLSDFLEGNGLSISETKKTVKEIVG